MQSTQSIWQTILIESRNKNKSSNKENSVNDAQSIISRKIQITPTYAKNHAKLLNAKMLDESKLKEILDALCSGKPLPVWARAHKFPNQSRPELIGKYDIHVQADVVLVCNYDDNFVTLYNIGTHNQLNLTRKS